MQRAFAFSMQSADIFYLAEETIKLKSTKNEIAKRREASLEKDARLN